MTLARARLALRKTAYQYLFDPNVSLVDFGYPEREGRLAQDEIAIRVHVHKKLTGTALLEVVEEGYTRPIPPTIGGFRTDVPEGTYGLHLWSWWRGWGKRRLKGPRARRADPMRGGISISDFHRTYGTLGGLVKDRATGVEMILSNWHVLVHDWGVQRAKAIYQPGRGDGGNPADKVATLARDAMSVNLDAAVATLTGNRQLINDQLELGPVKGVRQAELGMEVLKSGRRTGITGGMVTAVEGVTRINYRGLNRIIQKVVTIEPHSGPEVSAPGDSGSWWLDKATMRAIGLHFAGSNRPERALAIDMQSVIDALNVDIVV
jgi:endonuclease G